MNAISNTGRKSARATQDSEKKEQGRQYKRVLGSKLCEEDTERPDNTHSPTLISTPCFEIFQLLHFRETLPGPYSVKKISGRISLCLGVENDLDRAMESALSSDYIKSQRYNFKDVWAPQMQNACDRSLRAAIACQRTRVTPANSPIPFENPSTQAHRLVAVLLRMANMKNR